MNDEITVLIIDQHPAVCQALATRLRAVPSVNVVGSVCTVGEGLDWARLHRPDVILLELKGTETEGTDSADAIASLRAEGYSGVIVLTSYLDETEKTDALGAGARRYLLKEIDSARLVDEIEAVARERRLRFSSPFGSRGLNAGHAY